VAVACPFGKNQVLAWGVEDTLETPGPDGGMPSLMEPLKAVPSP
jgi:hypothetical protein